MTTFAAQFVCGNCKRYGFGHNQECTCNVVEFPTARPVVAIPDAPTPFTVQQEERDRVARAWEENGDPCRRWTRCGHHDCGATSPEMEWYWQVDRWEDDHHNFGCEHREPAEEPWEIDGGYVWPYPEPHPYRHHMEPAGERVHVHRPVSHEYTPHRKPMVLSNHAA